MRAIMISSEDVYFLVISNNEAQLSIYEWIHFKDCKKRKGSLTPEDLDFLRKLAIRVGR